MYAFTKEAFPTRRDDPNSHSYVVTLAPRLTLIGADCTAGYYTEESGTFKQSTLQWIYTQADSAVAKGDRVIAMMHYQLMEHTDYMGDVIPQALVSDYKSVCKAFRKHGIELVLTGHMHIDNISTNYTNGSDSLVEITTGTPVMYPSPYRMITASNTWSQFQCATQYITSLPDESSFTTAKNKSHFETTFQNSTLRGVYDMAWENRSLIYSEIDSIEVTGIAETILKLFDGKEGLKKLTSNLLNQIPEDSQKRATYLNKYVGSDATKMAVIHIEGNEWEKDTKDLPDDIFDDVKNLLYDLIDKAYIIGRLTLKTAVSTAINYIKDMDKVQDFFDGFFGDYTNYKDEDQNRTDDLRPALRFTTLPHRDYYATVYYDLNGYGENFVDSVLINEPAKIPQPKDPKAEGYDFAGWYVDQELTQLYDFNTEIIADDDVTITLYARWRKVVTFKLGDVKKMYDGTAIEPLFKPTEIGRCGVKIEVDTMLTNVGSVVYHVQKTTIWQDKQEVTDNYKIEWENDSASMVVTPRTITITTASAEKMYDGTALVAHDTTMTENGFVAGEGIVISYTGSQTEVGTSDNTIDFIACEGTNLDNYAISVVYGTLTVTPKPTSIIAPSDESFGANKVIKDGRLLIQRGDKTYTITGFEIK